MIFDENLFDVYFGSLIYYESRSASSFELILFLECYVNIWSFRGNKKQFIYNIILIFMLFFSQLIQLIQMFNILRKHVLEYGVVDYSRKVFANNHLSCLS